MHGAEDAPIAPIDLVDLASPAVEITVTGGRGPVVARRSPIEMKMILLGHGSTAKWGHLSTTQRLDS